MHIKRIETEIANLSTFIVFQLHFYDALGTAEAILGPAPKDPPTPVMCSPRHPVPSLHLHRCPHNPTYVILDHPVTYQAALR